MVPKACLRLAAVITVALYSPVTLAQDWLGPSISSYGGYHAALYNPALLSVSALRSQIGLSAGNVSLQTNYLAFKGGAGFSDIGGIFTAGNRTYDGITGEGLAAQIGSYFNDSRFERINDGSTKYLSVQGEYRGPSFMVSLGRFALSGGYRLRGGLQVKNLEEKTAQVLLSGLSNISSDLVGASLPSQEFSMGINAYHELGTQFAFPIAQIGPHYIGGGIGLKFLAGIYSVGISGRDIDFRVISQDSLISLRSDLRYQYVDGKAFADEPLGVRGYGFGVDAGVVYQWCPADPDGTGYLAPGRSQHHLRAGISATDMGQIYYSGPEVQAFDFAKTAITVPWGQLDTLSIRSPEQVDALLSSVFGASNRRANFTTGLPTLINIFGDLHLAGGFYAAATLRQSLTPNSSPSLRSLSSLIVQPRYESRIFEAALPIGVGSSYRAFQMGFYMRVSGFFIGSDNLGSLLGAKSYSALSLYAGGTVPIVKTKRKF